MTAGRKLRFALAGGMLLLAGILLLLAEPYRAKTVIASAGGCGMRVDVVEPVSGEPQGYVVLLHGLSANKRIMWYLAEGFAGENLRVFVPDLPGHGRTPGPFTPQRAESCAESLVHELIDRTAIVPQRTFLAGHSMGGAIALRVASRIPLAGVIAVSPAPTRPGHGASPEMLLFHNSTSLPPHSLILSGAWEPASMRNSAADLLQSQPDATSAYRLIPAATHVSLIFDSRALRESQQWIAQHLGLRSEALLPSHAPLYGVVLGMAGLCVLVVPFLAEITDLPEELPAPAPPNPAGIWNSLIQVAIVSLLSVGVLRLGVPLRFLKIFQGDYLASFLLIVGIVLLLWNWRKIYSVLPVAWKPIVAASVAAIALLLLFTGWLDLTFYEAWLTLLRWLRFPAVFLAVLPWHLAVELLSGPPGALPRWQRFLRPLALWVIAWLVMTAGLFYFRSGEVLLVLLAAYFAIFLVLQRLAVYFVYRRTRSLPAAAVFGAILFAGLALAIFPVA